MTLPFPANFGILVRMKWRSRLIWLACVALWLAIVPRLCAGRDAGRWFDGEAGTQMALARTVMRAEQGGTRRVFYETGSDRFDGQSAIAIHQMTVLGLGQILLSHPERRDELLPALRLAAQRLASPETLRYARRVYGHHGVVRMDPGEGHAYLGYVNLGLGMLRLIDPGHPLSRLHDRLTSELAARLDAASSGLIETYPGETWPPDVAAVAASIGLHARATGTDRGALLARWEKRFSACALHGPSGMLVQRVRSGSCHPLDAPRGSGTAIGAYFLTFSNPALAQRLYRAVRLARRSVLGFAGVREYPDGFSGSGDTNAGPILFGLSVGASGFGLGAARAHGDRDLFGSLYRSTHLLGVPVHAGEGTSFATGGVLGNALLLAMLTARAP